MQQPDRNKTKPGGSGLTQQDAKRRLTQFAYSELPKKKRDPLREFLAHFSAPIPWMIEPSVLANH
jgi:H+-transporting ATPase